MRRSISLALVLVLVGCGGSSSVIDGGFSYPANVAARYLPGSNYNFVEPRVAAPADPVVYSFATWGCNRISFGDVSKVDFPSTANQPWLAQLMEDIQEAPTVDPSLPGVPPHLFFTGDLVLNEENDNAVTLNKQLSAWTRFFEQQPLWRSQQNLAFLVLGNHEALYSTQIQPNVWREYLPDTSVNLQTWIGDLRNAGLFVPPDGSLAGVHKSAASSMDEVTSKLEAFGSYSIDVGDLHFVVLNTDTLNGHLDGEKPGIGWVQLNWLEQDLTAAEKHADLIFVFGHKPAVAFPGSGDEAQPGDLHINDAQVQPFIDTLNRHPKVAAYICAHAHAWGVDRLVSSGIAKQTTQLIAGNGGSILQESWTPAGGTYFGPTIVKVYRSGRVVADSYGRSAPNPIYTPPTGALQMRQEAQLYPLVGG